MTRLQRAAAAALVGLSATLAVLASPLLAGLGPVVPPHVPIDLRFVVLPVAFALVQLAAEHVAWPGPAMALPGAALGTASAANLPASQVLTYLGVPWARPGPAFDLLVLAASLGAVFVALWIAFDAAHDRFRQDMVDRGLDPGQLEPVTRWAHGQAREAVAVGALAVAGLGLIVRLTGDLLGAASPPLPELAAIVLVLGLGGLLVGVPRLRSARG